MKLKRAEVKEIITDEITLSNRADEIDPITHHEEVATIVKDIKATMRDKNLKFLSAPAIGYNKRIFCIDDPNEPEIKTYINPMFGKLDTNDKSVMSMTIETCSSIPDKKFIRFRQDKVVLQYQRPNGSVMSKQFSGLLAVHIQHEMEHLEGIVLSDFGLEIDDDWDKLTDDEKAEVIKEYKDSLDVLAETLNNEIIADPESKELNDGINFMTKVAIGEVKIEGIK